MPRRVEGVFSFPSPLCCKAEALGEELEIEVGGVAGLLALPGLPEPSSAGPFGSWLSPPSGASSELRVRRPDEAWGYISGKRNNIATSAKVGLAALWFDFPDELIDDAVRVESERIGEAFDGWITLLWNWIEALNKQSYLDPHSHTDKYQVQLRGMLDGEYSQANVTSLNTHIIIDLQYASLASLRAASRLASKACEIPLAHRLLSESRSALRSGDRRRAVIDAATAAELALTEAIDNALSESGLAFSAQSVVRKGFRMLGSKARLAKSLEIELPERMIERLIAPRNQVVHAGAKVEQEAAVDAVKAASELILTLSPIERYLIAE